MTKDLKKRVFTSIILIFLLFFIFVNNYILGYFLIIIGVFSLLEFFKINLIIFKKNIKKQLVFNLLFSIYIFVFFTLFLFLSLLSGLKILIFIILLTCIFSDIGGFIFGKILKGPKLTKISPKKTISGAVGSFFLSTIFLTTSITYLTKQFDLSVVLIGIIISLGCQLGDLFFSFLKRKSLLKDTGNLLPGHGGVLDRIDGMLLGIPIGLLIFLTTY